MKDADKKKPTPTPRIQIYDFVESELQYFRDRCNFSDDETCYFNLRAKHYSNQEIGIKMNVSDGKVALLSKHVKK